MSNAFIMPNTYHLFALVTSLMVSFASCIQNMEEVKNQWEPIEISLFSSLPYTNPYTDIDVWAEFQNSSGQKLIRPAFWSGEGEWKVRFASPESSTEWTWTSFASNTDDSGLNGQKGKIIVDGKKVDHVLRSKGTLKPSPGKRNIIHYSGESFLLVADTPWAMPFRATLEQVEAYAIDRKGKGFNAALLMSVQPDMRAEGPAERDAENGYVRGFFDLHEGHINNINPAYFDYLDSMVYILLEHEIVPVFQPVFHGFGWKGLDVLGNVILPEEYVRYCKYLLARYGEGPAIWLIAGDNGGNDPGVKEAGEMLEVWDAYEQPVGLHYNPCDDYMADWAVNNPLKHCLHYNKMYQEAGWLDFQWAQTGHNGDHQYHKVQRMYDNLPVKASANGEPTYEGMNNGLNGLGWWQGEEAWMQLMSGGTMGIVYGAAGLWQWKVTPDEAGWGPWASQNKSWKEAMNMEGSVYVGMLGKILEPFDLTDINKDWSVAEGKPLLYQKGQLYISYLNEGGSININDAIENMNFKWVNPKTGEVQNEGVAASRSFSAPSTDPWVLIVFKNPESN